MEIYKFEKDSLKRLKSQKDLGGFVVHVILELFPAALAE